MLVAIGRMKAGPERVLCARYAERAADIGRRVGITGPDFMEIPESKAPRADDRKLQEAHAIRGALQAVPFVCLDERGTAPSSQTIATAFRVRNEAGTRALALVIGGADGLHDGLRAEAQAVWSFGAATLPHQLVRIIAAEQIYRAMTILAGHPYHRA